MPTCRWLSRVASYTAVAALWGGGLWVLILFLSVPTREWHSSGFWVRPASGIIAWAVIGGLLGGVTDAFVAAQSAPPQEPGGARRQGSSTASTIYRLLVGGLMAAIPCVSLMLAAVLATSNPVVRKMLRGTLEQILYAVATSAGAGGALVGGIGGALVVSFPPGSKGRRLSIWAFLSSAYATALGAGFAMTTVYCVDLRVLTSDRFALVLLPLAQGCLAGLVVCKLVALLSRRKAQAPANGTSTSMQPA